MNIIFVRYMIIDCLLYLVIQLLKHCNPETRKNRLKQVNKKYEILANQQLA